VIVDTSAVVAVVLAEPDDAVFRMALKRAGRSTMSAANYLETGIVVDSKREPAVSAQLDPLLTTLNVRVTAVSPEHARIARQAYRDFGKGSGHRAQLNFGDCFAYALAQDTGEPLLYKGDDFTHAGVRSALG
jgi:ribonuclease VapC